MLYIDWGKRCWGLNATKTHINRHYNNTTTKVCLQSLFSGKITK